MPSSGPKKPRKRTPEDPQARIRELERQLAEARRSAGETPTTVEAKDAGIGVGRDVRDSTVVAVSQLVVVTDKDPRWLRQVLGTPSKPGESKKRLKAYLSFLCELHRYVDFRGMGVTDAVPLRLSLEDIYVPVRARVELPEGDTWGRDLRQGGRAIPTEDRQILGERFSTPQPVEALLEKHPGLVVLGDPGSGKTTFLRHLALRHATGEAAAARLPVLVPLAEFANRLTSDPKPAPSLVDFIPEYFKTEGHAEIAEEFQSALRQGRALVLLDGLDEVRDPGLRRRVVEQVKTLFLRHQAAGNRFVLTSRIVGYKDVRLDVKGLEECTLSDFERQDQEAFAQRWTRALEVTSQGTGGRTGRVAEERRAELLDAIENNPGVGALAGNPLLLTILSLMQRAGVPFPNRRVELYEHCLKTMLSTWNAARSAGRPGWQERDVVQVRKTLAPLALWMHTSSDGLGLVREAELQRFLEGHFLARAIAPRPVDAALPVEHDQAREKALQFMADVRGHCGVLLERGSGRFGFLHLTFEEYLAGVGLALLEEERDDAGKPGGLAATVRRILELSSRPEWREAIRLAVGYLALVQARESAASEVVRALAGGEPDAALLAGQSVLDVGAEALGAEVAGKVLTRLRRLWSDHVLPLRTRAEAGRLRGCLGDFEPGTGVVRSASRPARPYFIWCGPDPTDPTRPFPAGPFLMGGDPKAYQSSKMPFECTRVRQPFHIARYPVTVTQYQAFIDAGGYERDEFWPGDARVWRDGGAVEWSGGFWGIFLEEYSKLEFPIRRPRVSGVFQSPNHPQTGVSWFEAMAFCLWIQSEFSAEDWGKEGSILIRLPIEAEWELAATGGLGAVQRPVPWSMQGASVDQERLRNARDSGLEATSPVGLFSPEGDALGGAADLMGNVWEWCLDPFWPLQRGEDFQRFNAESNGAGDNRQVERVLRGGSWADGLPDYLRCATRIDYAPGYSDTVIGFRVVCVRVSASGG
jgi:formylglycine-generating enzyme required for sulfatase activity